MAARRQPEPLYHHIRTVHVRNTHGGYCSDPCDLESREYVVSYYIPADGVSSTVLDKLDDVQLSHGEGWSFCDCERSQTFGEYLGLTSRAVETQIASLPKKLRGDDVDPLKLLQWLTAPRRP